MTAVRMFNDIEMIPGQKLTVTMANWGDATNEGGGGADGPGEVTARGIEGPWGGEGEQETGCTGPLTLILILTVTQGFMTP